MVNKLEQRQKRRSPLPGGRPQPLSRAEAPAVTVDYDPAFDRPEARKRSDTLSTTSESYHSCETGGYTLPTKDDLPPTSESGENEGEADVQMHPCESKRLSPSAADSQDTRPATDNNKTWIPLFGGPPVYAEDDTESLPDLTSDSSESLEDEQGPSCILLNALHIQDIFDLPGTSRHYMGEPRFRPARLPGAINLRNLNIQQIKYPSISDIVLYAKGGVSDGLLKVAEMVARAQQDLYNFRMDEYYSLVQDGCNKEGVDRPVKYGVWCIVGELYYSHAGSSLSSQNLSTNSRRFAQSWLISIPRETLRSGLP
jgi:dual specificity MAP kinase phosphatase